MRVAGAGRTHPGRVRSRNEDSVLVADPVFAVADGMGGHAEGDIASAVATEALAEVARGDVTRMAVLDAIRAAHSEISERGGKEAGGMGTTLTGLVLLGATSDEPQMLVFNVGDSRSYRLRDGSLVQLTHDHSVVQELVDSGRITLDEAAVHPDRNVITRSLGGEGPVDIDWALTDPRPRDRFLVCSDGLSRELDAAAIAGILAGQAEPDAAADALIDAAVRAGGRDNVSVVVLDVLVEPASTEAPAEADPLDEDTEPKADGLRADTSELLTSVHAPSGEGAHQP